MSQRFNKNKKYSIISNKNQFQDLSRNEPIKSNNFTFTRNTNLAKFNYKTQLLSTNRKLNHGSNINKLDETGQKNNIYIDNLSNYYLVNDEFDNISVNNDIKIILFQNYLKFFSFYTLSKNKIQLDINLSIESISLKYSVKNSVINLYFS